MATDVLVQIDNNISCAQFKKLLNMMEDIPGIRFYISTGPTCRIVCGGDK